MTSYIWRATSADANKQCLRANGDSVIEFTSGNVSNGRHIHQTQFDITVAIGDNEKPQGNVNELQDVGVDSINWTITGSVESPATNTVFQTIKEWMLDGKTTATFTKGRFGLELDDILKYNLIPTGTGTGGTASVEQPRGYIISNWQWLRNGESNSKADFVATLRFNGDIGSSSSSPKYSWEVNHA